MKERTGFEPVLSMTVGEPHAAVVAVWREMGLWAEDLVWSRSRLLTRRVRAMRRLALAAGPGEAAALLERRSDVHVIRIMVARILVRIGSPAEIEACFAGFSLSSRLLEQPLAEVLGQVTVPQVTALLELLSKGGDPGVQRLVLVAAARIAPDECLRRLPAAAAGRGHVSLVETILIAYLACMQPGR